MSTYRVRLSTKRARIVTLRLNAAAGGVGCQPGMAIRKRVETLARDLRYVARDSVIVTCSPRQ